MNRKKTTMVIVAVTLLIAALGMTVKSAFAKEKSTAVSPRYVIQRAATTPSIAGEWESAAWKGISPLKVSHFYGTEKYTHKPKTEAKVVYGDKGIYIHFRVDDQYVRVIETEYHGKVWEDACVEFFVQPRAERGYFNFEINGGGTMLLSYKEAPDWKGETLGETGAVPWELAQHVKIYHSLPKSVDPELIEATQWQVEYFIPFEIFEAYLGDLGDVAGQTWRANFYKCAENNSHPHWASWSQITGRLDFHQPEFFSEIHFEK